MARVSQSLPTGLLDDVRTVPEPKQNSAQLFTRDNGYGKIQLCILLPDGTIGILWTQQ